MRGGYFALMTPVLRSYLDESADQKREHILVVAGFLSSEPHWRRIEELWSNRLRQDGIAYFRATKCKALRGQFQKLRQIHGSLSAAKRAADRIREDLEGILLSSPLRVFGVGIVMQDYWEILEAEPKLKLFFSEDLVEEAYRTAMYEIARTVRREAPTHAVEYVFDHSLCSSVIMDAFGALRKIHPYLAPYMESINGANDKEVPALQAADLIASMLKDASLEWLKSGRPRYVSVQGKWQSHLDRFGFWDKAHILHMIHKTVTSKSFAKGQLPTRERKRKRL